MWGGVAMAAVWSEFARTLAESASQRSQVDRALVELVQDRQLLLAGEAALAHEGADVGPVAEVAGHAPGGGVGMGDQPLTLEGGFISLRTVALERSRSCRATSAAEPTGCALST